MSTTPLSIPDLRDSLSDVLTVLITLGPRCANLGELTDLLKLAVGDPESGLEPNNAQLQILLDIITQRTQPTTPKTPTVKQSWTSKG